MTGKKLRLPGHGPTAALHVSPTDQQPVRGRHLALASGPLLGGSVSSIVFAAGLIAAGLFTAPHVAYAQTTGGELLGDVDDPQHLAVASATVIIENVATKVVHRTSTDSAGRFRVFPLEPGTYQVRVEQAGFRTELASNLVVEAAAHVKVNLDLSVGASTDNVDVSNDSPPLQTQDASVGATINAEALQRLPVNGRNYTRLILLSPGTSDRGNSQGPGTFSGTSLFSVNGQRQQDNNYTLDGVDNNFMFQNAPGMSPPMDAIQEFRVLNDTSAEFGRSAGANVNVVIKSGTNALHGALYEYVRNSVFDANDFFLNHVGRGKLPFRQNQFGAALGGPVVVPHLYDGHNRTFFFGDYEGFRMLQGQVQFSNTPTVAERNGDLSALGVAIYDPFNPARPRFAGGVIPQGRISPSSLAILQALQPLPNAPGLVNNLINTNPIINNRNLWNLRVDHQLSERDALVFRYSFQNVESVIPYTNTFENSLANYNVRNLLTSWVHTFSARTVLEARFGFNDSAIPVHDVNSNTTRPQLLQQAGLNLFQTDVPYESLPIFTVSGEFTYASGTGGGGQFTEDKIFEPTVNLTHIIGPHTLKIGSMLQIRHFFQTTANPMNGSLAFTGKQTGSLAGTGGDSLASFLLGVPASYNIATGSTETDGRGPYEAYFAQDDWRVSRKLTVNLGVRYEHTTPPYALNDQIGTLTINPVAGGGYTSNLFWAGNNQFTMQGPQQGGFGRSLQKSNYLDFAPRVGFAYSVSDRTVLRAGYGIFYNSTFFQELQDKRKFYPSVPQLSNTVNNAGVPTFLITSSSPPIAGNIGGFAQDTNKKSPYSQQWNLYVERSFPKQLAVEVGYFGSENVHQIGYTYINQAVPGPGTLASRRAVPTLGDLNGGLNIFTSNYNSGRVNVTKRYDGGLQFSAAYTFGKVLGEASSLAEDNTQNQYNRAADYGRLSYDVRHIFSSSFAYDLPFGRGRKFFGGWSRYVDAGFGGWSLEGIARVETGSPLNIVSGSDVAGIGASAQRPNIIGNPAVASIHGNALNNMPMFNTAAYAPAAVGTYGNASQNSAQADGRSNYDASVNKSWRVVEGQNVNFRAEFFNLPNHVNFINPPGSNLTITSKSFGLPTAATAPRQIQFAFRYNF